MDMDNAEEGWSEEETVSTAQPAEEQQSMINWYTDILVRFVAENPLASVPQIMEHVIAEGPLRNEQGILHLFRGRAIFMETARRMEPIRNAALNGRLGDLPAELRWAKPPDYGPLDPPAEDFSRWWAPQLFGENLFGNTFGSGDPEVPRYPSQVNTEEYFGTEQGESTSNEEGDMGYEGNQAMQVEEDDEMNIEMGE